MRYIILLGVLLLSLTACGEPIDDYDHTGTVKEIFDDEQKVLVDIDDREEMFLIINDQTELVGFEFEDFEVGETLNVHAPNLIEDSLSPRTVPARIAKENE